MKTCKTQAGPCPGQAESRKGVELRGEERLWKAYHLPPSPPPSHQKLIRNQYFRFLVHRDVSSECFSSIGSHPLALKSSLPPDPLQTPPVPPPLFLLLLLVLLVVFTALPPLRLVSFPKLVQDVVQRISPWGLTAPQGLPSQRGASQPHYDVV